MSVLKHILGDVTPPQNALIAKARRLGTTSLQTELYKETVKQMLKGKPRKKPNVENHIVAKTLKLKKAHVKKGTSVRLAEHQIKAMNTTMTRIVVMGCMVATFIGASVGFFTARYFYQQQSYAAFTNGVRAGSIQRDLKL